MNKKGDYSLSVSTLYFILGLFLLIAFVFATVKIHEGEKFVDVRRTSLYLQNIFFVDHLVNQCLVTSGGRPTPALVTDMVLDRCAPNTPVKVTLTVYDGDEVASVHHAQNVDDAFLFTPVFERTEVLLLADWNVGVLHVEVQSV